MKKVYLFGAGNNAYGVIKFIGKENIIGIVDNEKKKQGDIFCELPIIGFEKFLEIYENERVVITAAMYDKIEEQLKQNGIDNYTIAPMIIMGLTPMEEIIKDKGLLSRQDIYIMGYNIISEKLEEYLLKDNFKGDIYYVSDDEKEKNEIVYQGHKYITFENLPSMVEIIVCKERLTDSEIQKLKNHKRYFDIYENNEKRKKYEETLKIYHKKHEGQKCFIVGNGPSLQMKDLEKIQNLNIPTFGVNLIYKMYPSTYWRPTYFVITEYNIYRTYYDEINELRSDNLFIKDFYPLSETPHISGVNYYPGYARRTYMEQQQFSNDITKAVYAGTSVTYDTIQIASYMGFKEIYLIGVDFSYLNDPAEKGNHVYDSVTVDKRKVAGISNISVTLNAFQKAREYADVNGIKIYNATRGGKLEIFERKEIDQVLAEMCKTQIFENARMSYNALICNKSIDIIHVELL